MDFWQTDITYLKKVGPQRAQVLKSEANIVTNEDLLLYFPRKYVDKSRIMKLTEVTEEDKFVSLVGKLSKIEEITGKNGKKRLTALFSDGSGVAELVWFQGVSFMKNVLKPNEEVALFGRPTVYGNMVSFSHPELDFLKGEPGEKVLNIMPFYSSTEKLSRFGFDSRGFRVLMKTLLEAGEKHIQETLSEEILTRYKLISRKEALTQLHFPESQDKLFHARRRIIFEEFFLFQLLLAGKRKISKSFNISPPFPKIGENFLRYYNEFIPFQLTNAQKRVLKEIRSDLARPIQMNRLIQGDVGSGKTMVAFLTMLIAKDNGFQSVLMAPTEILAGQHFRKISEYSEKLGLTVAYLVGGQKKSVRNKQLEITADGSADIVIGTHALIEDTVVFHKLGLVVVDEQHKFGVEQRAKLWKKAFPLPHNMVMTATPIPRTLAMTLYGDIDVSIIDELPPGRQPIKTITCYEKKRLEIFGFLRREMQAGRQVYVVYPLVEESEKLDLLAVEKGYELLQNAFPEFRVGIVHGKMPAENKEMEMKRFLKKETQILVSTTVIEVGVDVPNASIMVIENAERFGLSQLHQLRGRVGRGTNQSYCVLMTAHKRSSDARIRLKAMVEHTDGFKISEIDLELRGPGDFLGIRQSGLPQFQLANITQDQEILKIAREAAFDLIEKDPDLSLPENLVLRTELQLYKRKQTGLEGVA
ncbi:MAG: ATP-dependent DNA helicase RecG [Bacteroidia bacterium]|nr:ATP-dependent DNA helicase RecG [Bacteroidia bacterium]